MRVFKHLRLGLDEKIHERSLVLELVNRAHKIEQQCSFPVHYAATEIGKLISDLIVKLSDIADTKAVSEFKESHTAQILGA